MSQPDQTPWKAVAGIEQNVDLLKRVISDEQGRYENAMRVGADLATAVQSYLTCVENTKASHDYSERAKYLASVEDAVRVYRECEAGQFLTIPSAAGDERPPGPPQPPHPPIHWVASGEGR